ncbi:DNA-binding protein (plasmid) [Cupriavidus sp. USMAA2-4]|uniref:H-NS histone family protein n=1 Tax=Cupriavidus sp. USMAA2-4 TaxID=876364 RepID=UPI0008A6CEDB|nr:H-NS histone family protein [Cupriavidus sp. USMAA2-4]AOY97453.1 DNA-binding protein [Cupriavidus sp. USMAA2-4]
MPTYKELLAQRDELDTQIEALRREEVAEVIEKIRQVMAEYGLTADDLVQRKRGRPAGSSAAKTPAPAKYRDPKTGATWSGRGRAPAWLGKNRARFLIPEGE